MLLPMYLFIVRFLLINVDKKRGEKNLQRKKKFPHAELGQSKIIRGVICHSNFWYLFCISPVEIKQLHERYLLLIVLHNNRHITLHLHETLKNVVNTLKL